MNPITKFNEWYEEETKKTSVRIPSACCLTSISEDGYPNSRFVSLKEVKDDKFVITGSLNSRKGRELFTNPKASLIFWWTETERQIRIQGDAIQIEDELANQYFKERSRASQIVSQISEQGAEIENFAILDSLLNEQLSNSNETVIKPENWSGFYIEPKRIEFMEFKENRLHFRELFSQKGANWSKTILQP